MIEIIDETLQIESCNIVDFTTSTMELFLHELKTEWSYKSEVACACRKNGRLRDVIACYNHKGTVIMNKDYKSYKLALPWVKKYLSATEQERDQMYEDKADTPVVLELFHILDEALLKRQVYPFKKMLKHISHLHTYEYAVIDELMTSYNVPYSDFQFVKTIFQYGKIQGKRAEREKKTKLQ